MSLNTNDFKWRRNDSNSMQLWRTGYNYPLLAIGTIPSNVSEDVLNKTTTITTPYNYSNWYLLTFNDNTVFDSNTVSIAYINIAYLMMAQHGIYTGGYVHKIKFAETTRTINNDTWYQSTNGGTMGATLQSAGTLTYPSGEQQLSSTGVFSLTKNAGEDLLVLKGLQSGGGTLSAPTGKNVTVPVGAIGSGEITIGTNAGYNVVFGAAAKVKVSTAPTKDATVTGSSGKDTISVSGFNISGANLTVSGGSGNDSVRVSNVTVSGGKTLSVEGGAGADNITATNISIGSGSALSITGGDGADAIDVRNISLNGAASSIASLYIDGGADNDNIYVKNISAGQYDAVTISGGAGNDNIYIEKVQGVKIDLGEGNDIISIQSGSNTDNNTIVAASGNNTIRFIDGFGGTVDAFNISLGSGSDSVKLVNNTKNFQITLGGSNDTVKDYINIDGYNHTVTGGGGDNSMVVYGRGHKISTGKGNDSILIHINYNGKHTVDTGAGDDVMDIYSSSSSLNAGEGNNKIYTTGANNTIVAGSGNDSVRVSSQSTNVNVGDGSNTVQVSGSNHTISTGSGNDSIYVEAGTKKISLETGDGKDTLVVGGNSHTINTGAGNDLISIQPSSGSLSLNAGDGADSIEIYGDNNTILAGEGNDYLWHRSGKKAYIDAGNGANTISSAGDYATIIAGTDTDKISVSGNYSSVKADKGIDSIVSSGHHVTIIAGDGDNTISVGGGTSNSITAGSGADKITLDGNFHTLNAGDGANSITASGKDLKITTGGGADTVTNTGNANSINTGAGNDVINISKGESVIVDAGEGADSISVGGKNNSISAGAGNDTVIVSGGSNYVNASVGANYVSISAGNNNSIYAGENNDTIIANGGNNNSIDAGGGNNLVTLGGSYSSLTAGNGNNSVTASGGNLKIITGTGADTVINTGDANSITTGEGKDVINISSGSSVRVYAGDGDDSISVAGSKNSILAGEGNDTVIVAGTNHFINVGDGADYVTVSSNNNKIFAGAGNDTVIVSGASNSINTGTDNDYISVAGSQNSIYAGSGSDTVIVAGTNNYLNVSVSAGYVSVTGNNSSIETSVYDDTVIVEGNSNLLHTYQGNDYITVTGDSNLIYGGADADTIVVSGASNTIYAGMANDYVSVTGGSNSIYAGYGEDTVIVSSGDKNYINASVDANYVSVSSAGNTIVASDGNDTVIVSGASNYVNTHQGNDYISVSSSSNTIVAGSGDDTVIVSGSSNSIDATDGADLISLAGGSSANVIVSGKNDKDTIKIANDTIDFSISGLDSTDILDFGDAENISASIKDGALNLNNAAITIAGKTISSAADLTANGLYDVTVKYGSKSNTLGDLLDTYSWYKNGDNSISYGLTYSNEKDALITISNVTVTNETNLNSLVTMTTSGTGSNLTNYIALDSTLLSTITNTTNKVTMSFGNATDNIYSAKNTKFTSGNLSLYHTGTTGWDSIQAASGAKNVYFLHGGAISGYSVSDTQIGYVTVAAGDTQSWAFEISGLTGTVSQKSGATDATTTAEFYDGIKYAESGSVVTVTLSGGVMGTVDNSTIKINGYKGNNADTLTFKLALDTDANQPGERGPLWFSTTDDTYSTVRYTTDGKTAGYTQTNDTTITYTADTTGTTLFTISGLDKSATVATGNTAAPTNVSLDATNKVITITSESVLTESANVVLTGADYKLAIGEKVTTPKESTDSQWGTDTGVVTYKDKDTLAGYVLSSDSQTISHAASVEGAQIFAIDGLTNTFTFKDDKSVSGVTLTNSTVTLTDSVLNNKNVYLVTDNTNYKLSIDAGLNPSATGSQWATDTSVVIYKEKDTTAGYTLDTGSTTVLYTESVAGSQIFEISGLKEKFTFNNDGEVSGVTLTESNSTVTLANSVLDGKNVYLNTTVEGYKFALDEKLNPSLTGSQWATDTGTVIYKNQDHSSGYTLDGTDSQTILYTESVAGSQIFEIDGLTDSFKFNADGKVEGVTLTGSTVTLTDAVLNKENVYLVTDGNYKLSISTDLNPSLTGSQWATDTGTVIYKNKDYSAGYTLDGTDSQTVLYTDSVAGSQIFAINGLKDSVALNNNKTVDGVSLDETKSTITLDKSVLTETNVYLVTDNTNYKLQLANDVAKPTVGNNYWQSDTYTFGGKTSGVAFYRGGDTSAGYTLETGSTTVVYNESVTGSVVFAVDGLNTEGIGKLGTSGVTISNSTITLTQSALNEEDIYLYAANSDIAKNYIVKLDDVKGSSTKLEHLMQSATGTADSTKYIAYMSASTVAGYDAVEYTNDPYAARVKYTAATAAEEIFRISGIDASNAVDKENAVTGLNFNEESNTVLIISDGNLLAGSSVMLTDASNNIITNYSVQLSADLEKASNTTLIPGSMTVESGTVGYIESRFSEGYINAGSFIYHVEESNPEYGFKLAGLETSKLTDKAALDNYVTLTAAQIESNVIKHGTLTLSTEILGDSSVTLTDINTLLGSASYLDLAISGDYTAPETLNAHFSITGEADKDKEYVSYYTSNIVKGYVINKYTNNQKDYAENSDTWTLQETATSISYTAGTESKELFKISGLDITKVTTGKDTDATINTRTIVTSTAFSYDTAAYIVTITNSEVLTTESVSVTAGEGAEKGKTYGVTLSKDLAKDLKSGYDPAHWESSGNTKSIVYYANETIKGYDVITSKTDGTYIEYVAQAGGASEAAITGLNLSSDTFTDIKVSGSLITMKKSVLDTRTGSEVSLTSSKYSFTLADDAKIKTTVESWAANKGNVTYKEEYFSEGYSLEDSTSISYSAERGGAEIKISGLATSTKTNSQGKISGIEISPADSDSTKTIFVSAALLAGQDVLMTDTSKQYSYVFDTDADTVTKRESEFWVADVVSDVGRAVLFSSDGSYTAGYEASGTSIVYHAAINNLSLIGLDGLKTNIKSKVRNRDLEITGINVEKDSDAKTAEIKIASTLIDSNGVTIAADTYDKSDALQYRYTLGGKAKMFYNGSLVTTLTGSSGNDSITNLGSQKVTIDGSRGNDVIVAGNSGDYIIADAGNDSITLGDGKDTVEYSAGKVVIQNFGKGTDVVDIGKLAVTKSAYDQNKKDLTLTIGTGSLKFSNIGETEVTVNSKIYSGYYVYNSNKSVVSFSTGADSAPTIAASVSTIDAATYTSALNLTGNSNNNYIAATKRNDTITTGAGNNTVDGGAGADIIISGTGNNFLKGGLGNDTFVFSGGNDTITDYGTGKDIITLASGQYTDAEVEELTNKLTLTFSTGSIVLENAAHKLITVDGEGHYYENHAIISNKKNFASLSAAATEFDANDSFSSLVTVDGSAAASVTITGNAKANVITAGTKGGVLNGGRGNDTLIGGNGADVFQYATGEGKDVIVDFDLKKDKISLGGGFEAIVNSAISGTDLVLTVNKQTLTVKDVAKDSTTATVNINDTNYIFGDGYYLDSEGNTATMYAGFRGKFNEDGSNTSVKTINAAASKYATTINGNDAANTITGGAKADSIYGGGGADWIEGGAGNDVLNGGEGNDTLTGGLGNDIFEYTGGEGNDYITDYQAGKDKIRITSGSIDPTKTKSNKDEVIFTVLDVKGTTEKTLTVKLENPNNRKITTIENGKTTTKNYPVDSSRTLDLLYDNNFTSEEFTLDDISAVKDSKYAVGSVKTSDTNSLVPDETALTYGDDDKK